MILLKQLITNKQNMAKTVAKTIAKTIAKNMRRRCCCCLGRITNPLFTIELISSLRRWFSTERLRRTNKQNSDMSSTVRAAATVTATVTEASVTEAAATAAATAPAVKAAAATEAATSLEVLCPDHVPPPEAWSFETITSAATARSQCRKKLLHNELSLLAAKLPLADFKWWS
jgi:hypothetical protein